MRSLGRFKPSALEAYRRVLRLIRKMEATEGTRLPTQAQLVTQLKVCAETLDAAMKWLVADGVVNRRQKAGTFVKSPYPAHLSRSVWNVGLVMPPITRSYFGAVIAHYLNKQASLRGIASRTYMLSPFAPHGSEVNRRMAADFTGLKEDLDAGLLDAIISSTRLVCDKVPLCSALAWEQAKFGVMIDQKGFVDGAIEVLVAQGGRRLMYVSPLAQLEKDEYPNLRFALESAASQLKRAVVGFEVASCIGSASSDHAERLLVRSLLNRREEERPDGLIIQNDISAQAVSAMLASTNYRPLLAVQTNRQIPLSYAIPSISFALDMEEIAVLVVDILLDRLLAPRSAGVIRYVEAVRQPGMSPSMTDWQATEPPVQ